MVKFYRGLKSIWITVFMKSSEMAWCEILKEYTILETSDSFIVAFNEQLSNEFTILTGKSFDTKRWYLFFTSPECITYDYENGNALARLKATLMFVEGRMEVSIIWTDRVNNIFRRPNELFTDLPVDFHWEKLDMQNINILQLPEVEMDVRNKYGINVPFPVYSFSNNLSMEMTIDLRVSDSRQVDSLIDIIDSFTGMWNKNVHLGKTKGYIHSFKLVSNNETEIRCYLDAMVPDETLIRAVLEHFSDKDIKIDSVELSTM